MTNQSEPFIYHIKIKGHLDARWEEWFNGMTITHDADGNSLLSGSIIDQSSLQGILSKIGSLNLELISVNQIKVGTDDDTNQ